MEHHGDDKDRYVGNSVASGAPCLVSFSLQLSLTIPGAPGLSQAPTPPLSLPLWRKAPLGIVGVLETTSPSLVGSLQPNEKGLRSWGQLRPTSRGCPWPAVGVHQGKSACPLRAGLTGMGGHYSWRETGETWEGASARSYP